MVLIYEYRWSTTRTSHSTARPRDRR